MPRPGEGTELDGFRVGARLHAGAMAEIRAVIYADGRPAPFPMVMKLPRTAWGEGSENILGFEIEHQMLQVLHGPHVPRFVAAGDLGRVPYLVMEQVLGRTLEEWMAARRTGGGAPDAQEIAGIGAELALAAHSLHTQNACHLDLKPANAMLADDGRVVLLDFGLSCHADYPDLLAEEFRKAVGSPAWIAPEQVVGVRGDPRSDVFAIGVILYEMAAGVLPFGAPATAGGMRQRLWLDPAPPRVLRPDLPAWLQEIILRCLEPLAESRYPSAAHLAFDLRHPEQVAVGARGGATRGLGFFERLRRWVRAAGMEYRPSPLPAQQAAQVPIVMVAVPNRDTSETALYALRQAVARSLGTRPGARLAVVSVLKGAIGLGGEEQARSETERHGDLLAGLKRWAQGLDLTGHQASFHVLEAGDVAEALLRYAGGNQVSLLILGAATHGLQAQRFIATVPIRVAMRAPCTVILVKEPLPFTQLGEELL
jgi:nucleotide-binding universal stress UspA family protein